VTDVTLAGCEPRTLLSHMALYGLGAILESAGARDVHLSWVRPGNPRPVVSVPGLDEDGVAACVTRHVHSLAGEGTWLQRDVTLGGTARGLMSPRLTQFKDPGAWEQVQQMRHEVLDALTTQRHWLDLQFLAALGEPCYWSLNRKGESLQDDGASRFEMQPRNQGSEFVGTRLRLVARKVAERTPAAILAGLRGESVRDEAGNDSSASRTATGLASPGPTDNALAWCAFWGISQYPIAMRVNAAAETSGNISSRRDEWFYVPMWSKPWRPARVRSVLACRSLHIVATSGLNLGKYGDAEVSAARAWLASRGVDGVVRFPVQRFGSDKAPERRAMRGEPIPV
jgi:CRISPR-associated protein Csb3